MKLCTPCHRPITRGHCGSQPSGARCLVCRTAELLRDFRYPASAVGQRQLRESKGER